jgi:hypothetical protein
MSEAIYSESDEQAIADLLMGHSVAVAGKSVLRLDDGTELEIVPNEGGCACSAGDYELSSLSGIENVITRVELAREDTDEYGEDAIYRIFVYAGNQQVTLVEVAGSDGNGYYGTGYEVVVRRPMSDG